MPALRGPGLQRPSAGWAEAGPRALYRHPGAAPADRADRTFGSVGQGTEASRAGTYPARMPIPRITPQRILDLLLDTVFVVDVNGRFVDASASCDRLLGYSADELRGTYMIEYVHPDDRSRTLQAAWKIIAGTPNALFENRWLHRDRHVVHLQWTATWAEAEQLRVAVARDITTLRVE